MTAPWVDALAAILRGTPKLAGALCRQRPDLFDGDDEEDAYQAAEICRGCPALHACAAWADTLRHNESHGVSAGRLRVWVSHPSEARENRKAETTA